MIRPVRADGRPDAGGVFTPIYRPRVQERLETAAQLRVTLIVAPAGYGKSISLRHFLDRLEQTHVRYDVRSDNAKLPGFVRGLADALSPIAPDARKTVASAHESAAKSTTPARDLALWMHAHLKAFSGVIAIDDLHVTEDDPTVTAFLTELIERTKGRVRWVLASRSYLDLPIGTWMAYQEMDLAIDEADLAFTPEEAREAARSARIGVRDEELKDLLSLTDGWPTALSFALRSSTRSLDLRNVQANTRELVYRYLAEQVYRTLDKDEREFLALAVLLPRIDIRTLQSAGYDDAFGRIEELRNHGAFIVPDVEQHGTYLCHELFRDFVRHQVSLDGVEAVRNANIRAAHALESAGDVASALALYAQARDTKGILHVLDEHGIALFDGARTDVIAGALDALDARARAHTMPLALSGLMESAAGRYDQAISQLKRAAKRTQDAELRGTIMLWEARAAINSWGQSPEKPLREVESDELVSVTTRAEASAMLSMLYARADRREEAIAAADRALLSSDHLDTPQALVRILQRLAVAASIWGDQELAERRLSRCAELCEQYNFIAFASRVYGWLYVVAWNRGGSVGELQWYAQEEMAMAERSGEMLDLRSAVSHALDVEIRRGSAERVSALEKRYLSIVRNGDSFGAASATEAAAWVHAWSGRFDQAYRLLSSAWERFDIPLTKALAAAVCALSASVCGRGSRVTDLVSEITKLLASVQAEKRSGELSITEAAPRLIAALAQAGVGRFVLATRLLREVGANIGPAAQAFHDLIACAIAILKSRAYDNAEFAEASSSVMAVGYGGYAKLIGAALGAFSEQARSENPAPGGLTPAEIAVLKRLDAGVAPKAIAEETGRSVYTVQAHLQNASEKLGCHGRHEVIATARRLGLLDP